MGIYGNIRRNVDVDFVHSNCDPDIIIHEPIDYPVRYAKPNEIFDIIERFCLGRRRVHLFGRQDCCRDGWLTIGENVEDNFDYDKYMSFFDSSILTGTNTEIEKLRPKSPILKRQEKILAQRAREAKQLHAEQHAALKTARRKLEFENQQIGQFGDEQFEHQFDGQFGSQFDGQFDRQFERQFDRQFDRQFGSQFDRQFGNQFDKQFGSQFENQFGEQFEGQFDDQVKSQFGGQFDHKFEKQFGSQFDGQFDHNLNYIQNKQSSNKLHTATTTTDNTVTRHDCMCCASCVVRVCVLCCARCASMHVHVLHVRACVLACLCACMLGCLCACVLAGVVEREKER